MQETAHQSPVFDCSAESSAGHTEVRDGELREKEELSLNLMPDSDMLFNFLCPFSPEPFLSAQSLFPPRACAQHCVTIDLLEPVLG